MAFIKGILLPLTQKSDWGAIGVDFRIRRMILDGQTLGPITRSSKEPEPAELLKGAANKDASL